MSAWISVEDRLPEDMDNVTLGKPVIVTLLVGSMSTETIVTLMRFKRLQTGFKWLSGDWQTVTHWMPLPSPPEQPKESK